MWTYGDGKAYVTLTEMIELEGDVLRHFLAIVFPASPSADPSVPPPGTTPTTNNPKRSPTEAIKRKVFPHGNDSDLVLHRLRGGERHHDLHQSVAQQLTAQNDSKENPK